MFWQTVPHCIWLCAGIRCVRPMSKHLDPCSGAQAFDCGGLQMYGLETMWMVGKPSLVNKPGPMLNS